MNTGFKELDAILMGLKPGSYNLIGARPAMGKSALALNIAAHVAMEEQKKVAYFSLEMSKEQVEDRVCLMRENIDITELSENLIIDDTAFLTVTELRKRCKELSLTTGLDLMIIDYLQLLEVDADSSKKYKNRSEEVSEISKGIKELAQELQVPIIVVTQLPRNIEWRENHRPKLDDLRVNRMFAIESDSDVVLFIYRDGYYDPYSKIKDIAEIIIAKNRYGETKRTVILGWDYMRRSFNNR